MRAKFCRHRRWIVAAGLIVTGAGLGPTVAADVAVVATIKPVHALVAQVMGATGTPELLVAGTASPHTFAMKPSDVQKFAKADIVFRMSETVEPFTVKLAAQLPKTATLVTLASARGIATLPRRAGGPFDTDAHKGHGHKGHAHDDAPKGGITSGSIQPMRRSCWIQSPQP
jgi:zinc transport system substrate-binding protein